MKDANKERWNLEKRIEKVQGDIDQDHKAEEFMPSKSYKK